MASKRRPPRKTRARGPEFLRGIKPCPAEEVKRFLAESQPKRRSVFF